MNFQVTFLLLFFSISYCFGQSDRKKEMTYDSENKLYYKITNDEQYLYLDFYKDENAYKALSWGGIQLFFNTKGKQDTVDVPTVIYPVYKSKRDFEIIRIDGFSDIPGGEVSVNNEYGIYAESKVPELVKKGDFLNNPLIFEGKISIPLKQLKIEKGNLLSIFILLRGTRRAPLPPGVINRFIPTSNSAEDAYLADLDTWSYKWVDYMIK